MHENQNFNHFKQQIKKQLEDQQRFDKLKDEEKELNTKIKQINEDLK